MSSIKNTPDGGIRQEDEKAPEPEKYLTKPVNLPEI